MDSSSSDRESEMITELMAEGFGYPLSHCREWLQMPANLVTVANQVTLVVRPRGNTNDEVPEGSPFRWKPPRSLLRALPCGGAS